MHYTRLATLFMRMFAQVKNECMQLHMHALDKTPAQQHLLSHVSLAEQAVDASESSAGSLASLSASTVPVLGALRCTTDGGAGAGGESSIASGKTEVPRMAPGAVPYP
jgi:hypothetical protein